MMIPTTPPAVRPGARTTTPVPGRSADQARSVAATRSATGARTAAGRSTGPSLRSGPSPAPADPRAALAQRVQPTTLAVEQTLPVLEPLRPLLPNGLRRGTTVQVDGVRDGVGSTSLALALAAGPSGAGSWVATVGVPALGLAAAAGYGIDLRRLVLVPEVPAEAWGTVVATLLDAFEVVLVRLPDPACMGGGPAARRGTGPAIQRRLRAVARERGAVLLRLGDGWAEAPDTWLRVVSTAWLGLGQGAGHLRARRATVEAGGRRGDDRPRRTDLWLPAPDGGVAAAAGAGEGATNRDRGDRRPARRWAADAPAPERPEVQRAAG